MKGNIVIFKRNNDNKIMLLASIAIILLSFIFERNIIEFNNLTRHKIMFYISIKVIYVLFVVVGGQKLINLLKQIRNGDLDLLAKNFIRNFIIYFCILIVVLIIVWPGIWIWDDMDILRQATRLELYQWHTYIPSCFYLFSLMCIPIPAGIVIMQIFFISLIVAYVMNLVYSITKNTRLTNWLYVIFLSPVIIYHDIFLLRAGMFAFLVVLLLAMLCKYYYVENKINYMQVINLSILITLIGFLRGEGMVILLVIPIIIILFLRKKLGIKKIIFCIAITILSSVLIRIPTDETQIKGYKLTTIVNALALMEKDGLKSPTLEQDYEVLEKVMSVEILKDSNPTYIASWDPWDREGFLKPDYTIEDENEVMKVFIKLVLNNPQSFLKAKLKTFLATTGMDFKQYGLLQTPKDDYKTYDLDTGKDTGFYEMPGNKVIFKNVRHYFIKALYFKFGYSDTPLFLYRIVWNVIPAMIGVLIISGIFLIRKKIFMACIMLCPLLLAVPVFLTAPESNMMYYLSVYVSGYVGIASVIIIYIAKSKCKGEKKCYER